MIRSNILTLNINVYWRNIYTYSEKIDTIRKNKNVLFLKSICK